MGVANRGEREGLRSSGRIGLRSDQGGTEGRSNVARAAGRRRDGHPLHDAILLGFLRKLHMPIRIYQESDPGAGGRVLEL